MATAHYAITGTPFPLQNTDLVGNPQREICDSLSARPIKADATYFTCKMIIAAGGHTVEVTSDMMQDIEFYLIQNGYVDRNRQITEIYHEAKINGTTASLALELAPYEEFEG